MKKYLSVGLGVFVLGLMFAGSKASAVVVPALPTQCPGVIGDYNVISGANGTNLNDFIYVGDGNSSEIKGGNGNDCILIGNNNTGKIKGENGTDVIVVGNDNTANIEGGNENDVIAVGDNNSGELKGGNGDDQITVGDGGSGNIKGEGGSDTCDYGSGTYNVDCETETFTGPDTTDPILTLPADIIAEATSSAGAAVTFSATATDETDPANPAVVCVPASGSTFAIETTTINCSATDSAGNEAVGSFTIEVKDTTPPDITVPTDISMEAQEGGQVVVEFSASANDLVDGDLEVECTPASGSTFSMGTTKVDCTATDAHENQGSASFNVIVGDSTGPSLVLPGNMTVEATSTAGATVSFETSATDLVDGDLEVECTPASGSTFVLGDTEVNCSASDLSDPANSSSGSFTVTVQDKTNPIITLNGDNPTTIVVGGTYTELVSANDLVDGDLTSEIVIDGDVLDTNTVGTYVITYDVMDAAGNEANQMSRTINVVAEAPITYTITVSAGANGSITPAGDEGSVSVEEGDSQEFTITADPGYHVVDVLVDGESQGAIATYTFSEVGDDHTISATFEADQEEQPTEEEPRITTGSVARTTTGQVLGAEKFVFTQYMALGSTGIEVTELQKYLQSLGLYWGKIDGIFGVLTEAAVKAFQMANPPLKVDGIVGPLTRAVLNK